VFGKRYLPQKIEKKPEEIYFLNRRKKKMTVLEKQIDSGTIRIHKITVQN